MPVLRAEPDLFPMHLFTADRHSPEFRERNWWLVHTRPRQEKALARDLCAHKVPFYLPLIPKRSCVRGRVVVSLLPLFTGYAFLLADASERLLAFAGKRVASTLPVGDAETLWHDLLQVRQLIASGAPIHPEDQLSPGKAVEIRSGPLAGLRGKIVQRSGKHRFIVEIDFIQKGASVQLDECSLAGAD